MCATETASGGQGDAPVPERASEGRVSAYACGVGAAADCEIVPSGRATDQGAGSQAPKSRSGRIEDRGAEMKVLLRIACIGILALTSLVAADANAPASVVACRDAFEQNLALGDSLTGKFADAAQAAEAQRLAGEALSHARSCIDADPDLAEAHLLCGMVLCTCYLPVAVNPGDPLLHSSGTPADHGTVLRRCPQDAEEGLAEIRRALTLAPGNFDYQLHCSEALSICGDHPGARHYALAVWAKKSGPSLAQRARSVRLLAAVAGGCGQPKEEARWLRKLLLLDPEDAQAAHRLVEVGPALSTGIAWEPYVAGMAIAKHERKPVLIDFRAPWCGWCVKLEKEVFAEPSVVALSREFVCIKVEATMRRDIADHYRIRSLPQAVLLGPSGGEVHRILGYRPVQSYLAEMRRGLAGR